MELYHVTPSNVNRTVYIPEWHLRGLGHKKARWWAGEGLVDEDLAKWGLRPEAHRAH